ncbi:MAG: biopolymer transporter ExbD [Bacteroidetes bacterium]|nr:MAG: biopolymer transporter ExbD [Bacteroidota bacterium]TNE97541.1 MAG: biopolymer transporter ExbD [Bacteroidota bacterium]
MNLGARNKVKIEGGMASMTDLVFLLLIFFIIMSLMSNQNTKVDVPQDSELPPIQDPTTATVVITEDDGYIVFPGGDMSNPREFEDIIPEAEAAVAQYGQAKLKIEGHKNASYGAVFKVMALAQKNGWDPVLAYKK